MTPFTIWSLEEMLRFYAASYSTVMSELARVTTVIELAEGMNADDEHEDRALIRNALTAVHESMVELPMSKVILDQLKRLRRAVDSANRFELSILARELHNNITVELAQAYFVMIPTDHREFFEQNELPFGFEVGETFPNANKDIAAASRCYALNEWTACVFHLMRVLEHGLNWLANDVAITNLDQENWKNILDQIEKKIRNHEQLPKSQEKSNRLEFLSAAAAQFRYFKDAWRNHVSHGKRHYDEREGPIVWTHVKEFMMILANHDHVLSSKNQ